MKLRNLLFPVLASVLLLSSCIEKPVGPVGPGKEESELGKDPLDLPSSSFVHEPSDSEPDISGTFVYERLTNIGHPRLLLTSEDFMDLKDKMLTDKALDYMSAYRVHKKVMDYARVFLEDPTIIGLNLDASGKRNLEMSNLALKRLLYCSYAYRMSGDNRFLEKVKSDLSQVCAMDDWHPSHFLDVAEMALGVSIAYDWLYYSLDYATRTKVRKKLLDCAILAASGQSFYTNKGNWNEVCNAGVIAASIVTYEQNRTASRSAIEKGVESNRSALAGIYSPDGNYPEGYGYWEYGTGHEAILLSMLKKAFGNMAGLDNVPGFLKTAEYILFMVGPSGSDFSYADGGATSERELYPMWWFAAYLNDPSLLYNELRVLDTKFPSASNSYARMLPFIPIFAKDFKFDKNTIKAPSSNIWVGHGNVPVALVRSSWTGGESDSYFAVKGGKMIGHGHMDGGSFVYDALGLRWAEDYQRPNYAEMESKLKAVGGDFWSTSQKSLRWDILKMNSYAHNTLVFRSSDGSVSKLHVTDHLVSGNPQIVETYKSDPDNLGVKLDLSSLYTDAAASVYRTIRLKNKKTLEIIDEITAKPGMAALPEFRMNTPADDIRKSGSQIVLSQSSKSVYFSTGSDSGALPILEVWDGKRPGSWTPRSGWDSNLYCKVVGWDAEVPAGKTVRFTTTITP